MPPLDGKAVHGRIADPRLERVLHRVDDLDSVRLGSLLDTETYRGGAVLVTPRIARTLVVDYVRYVAEDQALLADREVVDVVDRFERSARHGRKPPAAVGDLPEREVGIRTLQGSKETADIDSVPLDVIHPEVDVDLLAIRAPEFDIANARNALQGPLDSRLQKVVVHAQVSIRCQGPFQNRDLVGREVADFDLSQVIGQVIADQVELFPDFRPEHGRIGAEAAEDL